MTRLIYLVIINASLLLLIQLLILNLILALLILIGFFTLHLLFQELAVFLLLLFFFQNSSWNWRTNVRLWLVVVVFNGLYSSTFFLVFLILHLFLQKLPVFLLLLLLHFLMEISFIRLRWTVLHCLVLRNLRRQSVLFYIVLMLMGLLIIHLNGWLSLFLRHRLQTVMLKVVILNWIDLDVICLLSWAL